MVISYLLITGLLAGILGALLGLGGGVILIPVLTMLFHLPIHTAIGISLVGVIATSTGAAILNAREDRADIRLGMLLELGTTVGAITGAVVAGFISAKVLYLLFSAMLIYNAYSVYRKTEPVKIPVADDRAGTGVELQPEYEVKNVPLGLGLSGLAGVMSGLLGVGGGLIKIPVMYTLMGVPLKVASATSSFMVGITATASAFIYYLNGNMNPVAAVPVALGVFAGASIGLRLNSIMSVNALKKVFVIVFLYVALQMILKGLGSQV